MGIGKGLRLAGAGSLIATLLSCSASTATSGIGGFFLDRQAALQALARPGISDWTVGRLSSPELDRVRDQLGQGQAAQGERHVQALASTSSVSATGNVSSAPCYNYMSNLGVWVSDSGELLVRNMGTGSTTTYTVPGLISGDTFVGTSVTLSSDGKRVYLVSVQGNFYAVNLTNSTAVSGSPIALGGHNANVTVGVAPFIDALASRPDGQMETVYALNNSGTLFRLFVSAAATNPTPTVSKVQTYALPVSSGSYTEIFRTPPIVIGGQAVIGTWRKSTAGSSSDTGAVIFYNTGVNRMSSTAVTPPATPVVSETALGGPDWAPPALEFDNNLNPVYAFMPIGSQIAMVDLNTGSQASSQALVVDQTWNSSPNPGVSGSLAKYTLAASTTTHSYNASYAFSTADNTSETNLPNGDMDMSNVEGAGSINSTDSSAVYGYTQFNVPSNVLVVNSKTYQISDAQVTMVCNTSSNSSGNISGASATRGFEVSNTLPSSSTAWTSSNVTPTSRPAFPDGNAFNNNKLNSESKYEMLPNAGSSFSSGSSYSWGAKSYVLGPGTYSFGFANDSMTYQNLAGNNGKPHVTNTPYFNGGTSPVLQITLSSNSMQNPTMSNPVAIDSTNKRIYAVNTNALYLMSYASATYDGTSNPFVSASDGERFANFTDAGQTMYCLTALGRNTSAGPVSSSTYVSNNTAPLFMNANIFVQDNHPSYLQSYVNRFTPPAAGATGVAPVLAESYDLYNGTTSADAKSSATYMAYDNVGANLYVGTYDPASTSGRAWVLTQ